MMVSIMIVLYLVEVKDNYLMLLSFASPKESNQRKGDRKRQPHPVCPPATTMPSPATKQGEVRTFSGFLTRRCYVAFLFIEKVIYIN